MSPAHTQKPLQTNGFQQLYLSILQNAERSETLVFNHLYEPLFDAEANYLLLHVHGIAQVDGELADVNEAMLVRDLCVQRVHLSQSALHEVY